jgi:hypothetical protein
MKFIFILGTSEPFDASTGSGTMPGASFAKGYKRWQKVRVPRFESCTLRQTAPKADALSTQARPLRGQSGTGEFSPPLYPDAHFKEESELGSSRRVDALTLRHMLVLAAVS